MSVAKVNAMFWRKSNHTNGNGHGKNPADHHAASAGRVSHEIWLNSGDPATMEAVATALRSQQPMPVTATHRTLEELHVALGAQMPMVVLVDLEPMPLRRLAQIEPIIARFPATRFVGLVDVVTPELLAEAMNVGARQLIAKTAMQRELEQVLRRLMHSAMGVQHHGSVITFLSAGGGCGATTLAVNLARELPGENEPALLVDFDTAYGSIATYLGLEGTYGLGDVLNARDIDPQLIASTALKFDDHLHALLSPVSVNYSNPAPLRHDRLEPALDACRVAYRWVVVDAPRVPLDVAARLAARSRCTFIVSQLLLKDLRTARLLRQGLIDQGVGEHGLRYVINRYHSRRGLLSLDDAQRALGGHDVTLINNDFPSINESISLGQPLAQSAPRCAARRDICRLAQSCAAAGGNGHAIQTPTAAFNG